MTAQTLAQVLVSGLLIGLVYALIAAGLSLIFGLMEVVNFAHGEFLMVAMYATFGLWVLLSLDPIILIVPVAAFMFLVGMGTYRTVITQALKAKKNTGMVQIFSTFGLAVLLRGVVQAIWTPEYRNIKQSWLTDFTLNIGGIYLPAAQLAAGGVCLIGFIGLYLLTQKTDFGRALEATREDSEAVALIGVDRHKIFAMGWGIGAAIVGVAGVMLSTFYYIHPGVGATFALTAYVTVALGGFGSLGGALVAGIIIGLVESVTALVLEPSLKYLGIFALYLLVVLFRPRGLFGYF